MTQSQLLFASLYGIVNLILFAIGLYQTKVKKNAYGQTISLIFLGIFVWGDAVIFGLFWFLASLISILLSDWILFLLIISTFWLVRSVGETIYWFNQQFSTIKRQPPEKLPFYSIFRNDSVWFGYQIFMQTITVVSIITTAYLFHLWL